MRGHRRPSEGAWTQVSGQRELSWGVCLVYETSVLGIITHSHRGALGSRADPTDPILQHRRGPSSWTLYPSHAKHIQSPGNPDWGFSISVGLCCLLRHRWCGNVVSTLGGKAGEGMEREREREGWRGKERERKRGGEAIVPSVHGSFYNLPLFLGNSPNKLYNKSFKKLLNHV